MTTRFVVAAAAAALLVSGCQNIGNQTLAGAGLGALAGGGLGALFGDDANDRRDNALLGAGIGALAGGAIGAYLDQQEASLRQGLAGSGAEVQRQGDQLIVNLPSQVTFPVNSDQIQPQFYGTLNNIASTLVQYPQSIIDIAGHTDSTGDAAYNQDLSQRRAASVQNYLISRGVQRQRVLAGGFGETRPIAPNNTELGRAQNRRVEIVIRPYTG